MTWGTQYSTHRSCSYWEKRNQEVHSALVQCLHKHTKTNCTKRNRQHIFISVCTTDKLFFPGLSHERSVWNLQRLKGQKSGCCVQAAGKSWASRLATARLQMTGDNKMYKMFTGSSQKSARLSILFTNSRHLQSLTSQSISQIASLSNVSATHRAP